MQGVAWKESQANQKVNASFQKVTGTASAAQTRIDEHLQLLDCDTGKCKLNLGHQKVQTGAQGVRLSHSLLPGMQCFEAATCYVARLLLPSLPCFGSDVLVEVRRRSLGHYSLPRQPPNHRTTSGLCQGWLGNEANEIASHHYSVEFVN